MALKATSDDASAWKRVESGLCEAFLSVVESQSPGLLAQLVERWKAGRRSAERVLSAPSGNHCWGTAAASAVEALLVLSRERQRADPLVGMQLAEAAIQISEEVELGAFRATGWILLANAARLRGMPANCGTALTKASRCLLSPIDEGLYARALGLLRHEEGRGVEAVALLDHARRCFAESSFDGEAGCCLALRCLVELEWGRSLSRKSSRSSHRRSSNWTKRRSQGCTLRSGQRGHGCSLLTVSGTRPWTF